LLFFFKENFAFYGTVIFSFLKRERERFPLFVPKRYCVPTRKFLGVSVRSTFLTVCMNVFDRFMSVYEHFRPFYERFRSFRTFLRLKFMKSIIHFLPVIINLNNKRRQERPGTMNGMKRLYCTR
jgi:hypothetical protein